MKRLDQFGKNAFKIRFLYVTTILCATLTLTAVGVWTLDILRDRNDIDMSKSAASTTIETSSESVSIEDNESPVPGIVLDIRAKYNEIQAKLSSGIYKAEYYEDGVIAYKNDGGDFVCAIVPNGFDGNNYIRNYYFDENKLFFAYYESLDSHRFYFFEDQLVRWRYCSDSENVSNAVNHDGEDTEEYQQWNDTVLREANTILQR